MQFTISDRLLREMFRLSSFSLPEDEMVFVALRGVQPLAFGGTDFGASHEALSVQIDYRHMRCTIVQWKPSDEALALFVGSSVPHLTAVQSKVSQGGEGVNRLCTGYYGKVPGLTDYRYHKGHHGWDRHLAFRNEQKLPVWRTGDDADYEGNDRFEVHKAVYDNLHCARQTNETASRYDSYGCIVVAGSPGEAQAPKVDKETGPWRKFLLNAYSLDQSRFALALFEEGEAYRTAQLGLAGRAPTVRFGSKGVLVLKLQEALAARGYDLGSAPDGLFGPRTALALHRFQLDSFGPGATDIIAGAGTATALGITDWPATGEAFLAALSAQVPAPQPAGPDLPTAPARPAEPAPPAAASTHDPSLSVELDQNYLPLPGWRIDSNATHTRWSVTFDGAGALLDLGFWYTYNDYSEGPTKGLARTTRTDPRLPFDPADWETAFSLWPELLYPTAMAESGANFLVVNAWDRAAMTLGFMQLAAHTDEDLLPFFRRLLLELPRESGQWFPELMLVDGTLCFSRGGRYRSLENAVPHPDGGHSSSYYRGDFMRFFNPDRYHRSNDTPDPAELQTAARWLVWTSVSETMRSVQVAASIENMKGSVAKLHRAMRHSAKVRDRYPHGVDGMRCDVLSVALAALHLGERHMDMVLGALLTAKPAETIRDSGYGPGDRAKTAHIAMKGRPRLADLVYDLDADQPA